MNYGKLATLHIHNTEPPKAGYVWTGNSHIKTSMEVNRRSYHCNQREEGGGIITESQKLDFGHHKSENGF